MDRDRLLVAMTAAGSAFCWWPVIMQPNLNLPFWWFPLTLMALVTGLTTILSDTACARFIAASCVGMLGGTFGGFHIWPPTDSIAVPFLPLLMMSAILKSLIVSLVAGLALRLFADLVLQSATLTNHKFRRAAWSGLICCVACGPVIVVLTPPLVAHRMTRKERVAQQRIVSLDAAVVLTMTEGGDRGHQWRITVPTSLPH